MVLHGEERNVVNQNKWLKGKKSTNEQPQTGWWRFVSQGSFIFTILLSVAITL